MAVFMAVFLAYKNLAYFPIKYGRKVFLAFLAYIPLTPKYISTPPYLYLWGRRGGYDSMTIIIIIIIYI
tara:strand:- start:166 stop:372 length:207 start_codon:yes stop_codon:yes gene_type:complete